VHDKHTESTSNWSHTRLDAHPITEVYSRERAKGWRACCAGDGDPAAIADPRLSRGPAAIADPRLSRAPASIHRRAGRVVERVVRRVVAAATGGRPDRKSTRLNSSHVKISYAVFCLKKKT